MRFVRPLADSLMRLVPMLTRRGARVLDRLFRFGMHLVRFRHPLLERLFRFGMHLVRALLRSLKHLLQALLMEGARVARDVRRRLRRFPLPWHRLAPVF